MLKLCVLMVAMSGANVACNWGVESVVDVNNIRLSREEYAQHCYRYLGLRL